MNSVLRLAMRMCCLQLRLRLPPGLIGALGVAMTGTTLCGCGVVRREYADFPVAEWHEAWGDLEQEIAQEDPRSNAGSISPSTQSAQTHDDQDDQTAQTERPIGESEAIRIAKEHLRANGWLNSAYEIEAQSDERQWRVVFNATPAAPGKQTMVILDFSGGVVRVLHGK